jgi:hypothetical protein
MTKLILECMPTRIMQEFCMPSYPIVSIQINPNVKIINWYACIIIQGRLHA